MSLSLYNKKRNFSKTPEPSGKEKSSKDSLRFVIQKHDASHLHYDFRLEMDGVLKSWAVPKGPSLNPSDKRLAMMVEDHPYDYRNFEGIIPEGNYGAGVVMVWDEGYYEPLEFDGKSKKEQEKILLKQLHSGSIKIIMHGKKLKGEFALVKIKKDESGKSWLLIKHNDKHATETAVTEKNKSVVSNKTLAKIAEENDTELNHPEEKKATKRAGKVAKKAVVQSVKQSGKRSSAKKTATKSGSKKKAPELKTLLGKSFSLARKVAIPSGIKPMLATLTDDAFDDKNWLFEIKWDGYRALAIINEGDVKLVSRNNKPFTERYTPVTEALAGLAFNAILDGEIIAMNDDGKVEFQLLQNWQSSPETALQYYAFDILWLNGYDLTAIPLIERKRILESILLEDHIIRFSSHIVETGIDFFDAAMEQGLEGIMAKRAESRYTPDNRSRDWLKIKVNQRQEVVIAGYTAPRNTRKNFGALILGVYDGNDLVYVGHTGSGFNQKKLDEIYNKLRKIETKTCPFKTKPKTNMPVTWVKPELVCEIKFTEWTKLRIARHPIFMGLREDKKAKDVVFEKAKTINTVLVTDEIAESSSTNTKAKSGKIRKKVSSKTKGKKKDISKQKQLSIEDGKEQIIILNRHELKLTNLDKLYWKKDKCRKMDMINYYLQVAPYMMPYMKDRPQSLNRHPNGIDGKNFYQKDMAGKVPGWMTLHRDFSESTQSNVDYLVCSDEATLIYMANLGCIEMHPWHARTQSWQYPDWCLIDLDPGDGNTFEQVIETAQVVKKVLDSIGAVACVKTSGSSGIHIYIPLGANYDYDQSRQLAELVVTMVHWELPEITSLDRSPSKRKNKIYLDYLQNRQIQTAAAPYSLRPKPGVPVSTPLHWDEVKKGLTPTTYNIYNIMDRLNSEGDLFAPVLGKGINLEKVLKKLAALMK